jgi:hypothetical protein
MFTGDFVACAMGYKALGDAGKAADALQQGADFAMNGDENVVVGIGTQIVTGDSAAAAKVLAGALKEISTTEPLYALLGVVAGTIKDMALSGQIVEKIQAKCGRAADFARLANVVAADMGDAARAGQLINEAAAKYGSPADLIALSGAMANIDPAGAAALHAKALESAKDFNALMSVLKAAEGNADFTKAVLAKGLEVASSTAEFLQLADACATAGDAAQAVVMVNRAEDCVAGLDEMRKVVDAVEKYLASDAGRVAAAKDKLARREANQAKYVELQSAEAQCKTVKQYIALADRIMAELGDAAYAAKVLSTAETLLREDGFHFSRFKPLIMAVDRVGDKAWLSRLVDESVATAADFLWFREIVLSVARELSDSSFGKTRAKAAMDERAAQSGDNAYDWTKLAELAGETLNDASETARLLSEAAGRARDHFALAQVAKLYHDIGHSDAAGATFVKAADSCADADAALQLAHRLKGFGMDGSTIAGLMDGIGSRLSSAGQKLAWAAGVADLLMDKEWAQKTYDGISGSFSDEVEKRAFERSKQMRMGYRFYGPGAQPH